jgi:hypothetical protein
VPNSFAKGSSVGKTGDVEFTLRATLKSRLLGSSFLKPQRKTMKVRDKTFRQAQDNPAVQSFLAEARKQDEELHRKGLIHP